MMGEEDRDGDDKDLSVWRVLTFGATKAQIQGFIMIGWRAAVMFHIFWVCGWLVFLGFNPPFASELTTQQMNEQISNLKQASELSTKLSLIREIRLQTDVMCALEDRRARGVIQSTIDKLREDYALLTKASYPEPRCDEG